MYYIYIVKELYYLIYNYYIVILVKCQGKYLLYFRNMVRPVGLEPTRARVYDPAPSLAENPQSGGLPCSTHGRIGIIYLTKQRVKRPVPNHLIILLYGDFLLKLLVVIHEQTLVY